MTSGTRSRSDNALTGRGLVHHLAAVGIMGIYGGQVCPLVEGLDLRLWFGELIVLFGIAFFFRGVLAGPVVLRAPYQRQVRRQFLFEWTLFIAVGAVITALNYVLYGFPPVESGLKMVLGAAALGFFDAIDLSLARERVIAAAMAGDGKELLIESDYLPLTHKFTLVAVTTALFVSGILLLLILKDLGWMVENVHAIDAPTARSAVLKEIAFVTAILLLHIFNLILSYSKNLRRVLDKENTALMEVASGNLDSHVIVSTNDEFGVMARYTNVMIEKLRRRTDELQRTRDVTILALASLAETRDNETGDHILRTQRYVRALAVRLKGHPRFAGHLDEATIDLLYKSAPLHDVGKVGIPDRILQKPGPLDPDEFEIMKEHAVLGRDALRAAADELGDNNFLRIAQEIAHTHHEKWDGGGYPRGLRGDEIPISGRLMALADVYDALISERVYKPAFPHEKARQILVEGGGTHFDPDVLDAFVEIQATFAAIARGDWEREPIWE